jgi:hypothetical protein
VNRDVVVVSAAGPKVNRPGKRDHCQVDRWDRSAEASVWHVTGRACLVFARRDIPVVKHKFAERFYCFRPRILKDRRLTCQNRLL